MKEKLQSIFQEGSPYRLFFTAILATNLGYGLYKGMQDNYLSEIVSMGEFDRGVLEFFREIPGLLLVFILAALYMLSAETMYKLGAVIMMGGMAAMALVPPDRVLVTLAICTYSLGEHIQLGMKNTLALTYSKPGKGGSALGYMSSIGQAGTLMGYVIIFVVFLLAGDAKPFKPFFALSACIITLAMFCGLGLKGKSETDKTKSRFYFHKKFKKFYMLEIFYGARKQVFFTFGPYVLIRFYGAGTSVITLLFLLSAVSCYFLSPVVGKIIDKLGYKIVMISDTLILVIVCFFYGFAHHIFPKNIAFVVCCINYILDSIISLAALASNVYVQDLADSPEEMRATISTGVSVNHLITIFIALFGGWIWKQLGIETLFILSAVLGLCNSAYAATIKTGGRAKA